MVVSAVLIVRYKIVNSDCNICICNTNNATAMSTVNNWKWPKLYSNSTMIPNLAHFNNGLLLSHCVQFGKTNM